MPWAFNRLQKWVYAKELSQNIVLSVAPYDPSNGSFVQGEFCMSRRIFLFQ